MARDLAQGLGLAGRHRVGDHHDRAALPAVAQHLGRQRDGVGQPVALARHDRGRQRIGHAEHDVARPASAAARDAPSRNRRSGPAGMPSRAFSRSAIFWRARSSRVGARSGVVIDGVDPEHDHRGRRLLGEGRRLALPGRAGDGERRDGQPGQQKEIVRAETRDRRRRPPERPQQLRIDRPRASAAWCRRPARQPPQDERRHEPAAGPRAAGSGSCRRRRSCRRPAQRRCGQRTISSACTSIENSASASSGIQKSSVRGRKLTVSTLRVSICVEAA